MAEVVMTARPRYFDALVNPAEVIARTSIAHIFETQPKEPPPPSPPKPKPPTVAQLIVAMLVRGALDTGQIHDAVGGSLDRLRKVGRDLKRRGVITIAHTQGQSKPALWALATQETKR